jgi:hypothetical protein
MEMAVFWNVPPRSLVEISGMFTVSIIRALALVIEAVSAYKFSVSFYQTTRHNISEDNRS